MILKSNAFIILFRIL